MKKCGNMNHQCSGRKSKNNECGASFDCLFQMRVDMPPPLLTFQEMQLILSELMDNGPNFYKEYFNIPNDITKKICGLINLSCTEYISH